MPSRLTEADREHIARTRRLLDLDDAAAVREHAGLDDPVAAYTAAFAEAQELLTYLAIRLVKLGGS